MNTTILSLLTEDDVREIYEVIDDFGSCKRFDDNRR